MDRNKTLFVRMDDNLHSSIKAEAAREKITMQEWVRRIFEREIRKKNDEINRKHDC